MAGGAKSAAAFKAEMASLKRQMAALTEGSYDPSPELKKLRESNAKLKYQLNHLRHAASGGGGAAGAAAAGSAPAADVDVAKILAEENAGATAADLTSVLTRAFAAAVAKTFPGLDVDVAVVPNTAVGAGKKGGKGKGKKGKGADADAEPSVPPMYQCADAMKIFGKLKKEGGSGVKSPAEVAQRIIENLAPTKELVERCEAAGGFINIWISRSFLSRQVSRILIEGAIPPPVTCKVVTVDFSSPNIAKIMHVGHLRSTVIGESICRLLEYVGHKVNRVNHVGDWGTQFGMLIANLKDKFPNFKTEAPPIGDLLVFYKESKKRCDAEPDFKERAKKEVVALQAGEPDVTKAWQLICDVSRKEFSKVYKRLGVTTNEYGESFYQSRMIDLVKELDAKNLLVRGNTYTVVVDDSTTYDDVAKEIEAKSGVPAAKQQIYLNKTLLDPAKPLADQGITPDRAQDGKFVFMLRAQSRDEPSCAFLFAREDQNPLIVQKTDGGFGYHASDLACIKYRIEELKSEWIVYVVDAGQSLHFQQVYAGAEAMGLPVCHGCVERNITGDPVCKRCDGVRVDHTAFGVVLGKSTDPETGKVKLTKLKTREGDTVALQWLLDEGVKKAKEFRERAAAERKERGQEHAAEMELTPAEAAAADEAIAYSCIKYADLSHDRIKDYAFSFDSMLSPKGDTAVYLINAYARIKQVLAKPEVAKVDVAAKAKATDVVTDKLPAKGQRIAEHLARFPERVSRTVTALMPNYMCEYLYELASMVHEFYSDEDCRVIDHKNDTVHVDRVLLFAAAAAVMDRVFHIVGLQVVDKM